MTGIEVDLPVGGVGAPAPRREPALATVPTASTPTEVEQLRRSGRRRPRTRIGRVFAWIALSLLGVVFVYPFVWLVSASFKPRTEVFDNRLIPQTFTFDNYIQVWQEAPLALWLLNTVIVTVLAATLIGDGLRDRLAGERAALRRDIAERV